jgi:2,3-dihydroxybiphenyl 1,2-dioxygenase
MQHQLELGHLTIEVPEPSSLDAVLGEVVGLIPGEPTSPGARSWRNDARASRLEIVPGAANDAVRVGFDAVDAAAFDTTIRSLHDLGVSVEIDESVSTGAGRIARMQAPWGTEVEIVLGAPNATSEFSSPLVPGGFLTEGMGFGHVVFATTAFDESHRFLVDGLGFGQSDWVETEIAEGIELEIRFYHCNPRHHTIALAHAPFELPQRFHHVMFEVNDHDDVGRAFDRAWAADLPIPNGLGRHDNDGMFSFYLQTPAGFQIEIGHGAKVVTDNWDANRRYDRISAWGHQPLRSA